MAGDYLVDTHVVIKLLNGDERSSELFNQSNSIYIPVIVAGELFYGAENSTRIHENHEIFDDFLSQYEIIDVDLSIAEVYGRIKTQLKKDGMTIPENDLWVAATAIAYQFTLITYDQHYSKTNGLNVIS